MTLIDTLLPTWVRGWTLVRGLAAPLALPEGVLKVEVGQPDQLVRYVVSDSQTEQVARLAHALHQPATWLKVCAERETVAALLQPHWQLGDQRYFMRTALAETPDPAVPTGFTLSLTEAGPVTRAIIRTAGGLQAADGNLIVLGRQAVFDQIGTETAFRRQGLARLLMQSLANRALARGADEGLLVATEAGRQLYITIGWQTLSPYTSAFIPVNLCNPLHLSP